MKKDPNNNDPHNTDRTVRVRQRRKKRRRAVILLALLLLAGGAVYYGYNALNPREALATARVQSLNRHYSITRRHVTILLLGNALSIINGKDIKNPKVRDRTDAMMLISLDTKTGGVHVLSIPRDSLVDIPHVGETKLNEANYFGGPKLAVKEVEHMLGVPVDFYLETTMWNFADIINQLGGLTVDVKKPMHYGGTGNYLDINLNPGVQHLDGQEVLEFARFRHEPLGSIARSFQQQEVVKDLMHKLLKPANLPKLPEIALELRKDIVYTNLHTNQLLSLAVLARKVSLSDVQFATIPGTPTRRMDPYMHIELDYWVDNTQWEHLLAEQMVGKNWTAAQKKNIHFEVRSGTDSLAPAKAYAAWLISQGYSVNEVIWANHHDDQGNTITNFTGDKTFADQIAAGLGSLSNTTIDDSPYHDQPDLAMVVTVGASAKIPT